MFISEDEKEPREQALKKLMSMMSDETGKRLMGIKKGPMETTISIEKEDDDDDNPFDDSDNEDDHDFDTTDADDTEASFAHGGEVSSVTDRWQNDNGAGGLSEEQKAMIADLYNKHCR